MPTLILISFSSPPSVLSSDFALETILLNETTSALDLVAL